MRVVNALVKLASEQLVCPSNVSELMGSSTLAFPTIVPKSNAPPDAKPRLATSYYGVPDLYQSPTKYRINKNILVVQYRVQYCTILYDIVTIL